MKEDVRRKLMSAVLCGGSAVLEQHRTAYKLQQFNALAIILCGVRSKSKTLRIIEECTSGSS